MYVCWYVCNLCHMEEVLDYTPSLCYFPFLFLFRFLFSLSLSIPPPPPTSRAIYSGAKGGEGGKKRGETRRLRYHSTISARYPCMPGCWPVSIYQHQLNLHTMYNPLHGEGRGVYCMPSFSSPGLYLLRALCVPR